MCKKLRLFDQLVKYKKELEKAIGSIDALFAMGVLDGFNSEKL